MRSLTGVEIVQLADGYPIAKEHGVDFLMDNRHLWLRSTQQWAILRVRATVVRAIRNWLDGQGFTLVDAPILTPAACEGTTTLFETEYFGDKAYLTQSGQLYNEAAIAAFGRTYCFGPTFRAEKSKTRRHLIEFWMVEPEMAYVDLEGNMEVMEEFVPTSCRRLLHECAEELKVLERDTAALEAIAAPFPRISYTEALEILREAGDAAWGEDFGAPHETPCPTISWQARVRPPLPGAVQGVLHGGGPRGRAAVPLGGPSWPPRAMGRSSAGASARRAWRSSSGASPSMACRARRSSGTSTYAAMARCRTRGSAWGSSGRCPGSVASTTSARRSPSRGRSGGCTRRGKTGAGGF